MALYNLDYTMPFVMWRCCMKIAVCDDQKEYRHFIIKHLNFYFNEHLIDLQTYECESGEALLASNEIFDIVFLDIEMEELNGIQTAKELNRINKNTVIFIITAYQKYLDDAMDLNVFRYIDKPIQAKRLYNGLDKAIEQINNNGITFRTKDDDIVTLRKSEIVFVEVKLRTVYVTTIDRRYVTREKMSFFRKNLTATYFAIPHASYIINFSFVKNYYRDHVIMKTGHTVSIAPKKQNEIKKKFIQFLGDGYGSLSDNL